MVGVVQLVERQIVVLVVGGSSPFAHPILCRGIAKAVRHKTLTLACVGSSPATPAIDPLAQLAEHLTFNQGVRSSNLRWVTILLHSCGRGGMADAPDLGSGAKWRMGSSPFARTNFCLAD